MLAARVGGKGFSARQTHHEPAGGNPRKTPQHIGQGVRDGRVTANHPLWDFQNGAEPGQAEISDEMQGFIQKLLFRRDGRFRQFPQATTARAGKNR